MPLRWLAVLVFSLSSALNFLDRLILAALAPQIMSEFHLTAGDYGDLILAFSLTYAIAAPLAGFWIDRIGLNRGSTLAVGAWSLVGIASGLMTSLRGLAICRALLGATEAAGIPGTGKASAIYLEPRERALGSAVSQMGLTLGSLAAPLFAQWMSIRYGWRSAFVVAGALGFLWIPLWWFVSRRVPQQPESLRAATPPLREVLGDTRYWKILAANVLLMSIYTLWVNWTTVFLVRQHGLTQQAANSQLAWIPPIFATAGGLFGGWLSLRWARNAGGVIPARLRAFLLGAVLCLVTAAVPFVPSPGLATAAICASFFASVLASTNLYALPLDLFGSGRAAFSVAGLTSVYGLLQGVFSSIVGRIVDQHGFGPVCVVAGLLPLAAYLVLRSATRERP